MMIATARRTRRRAGAAVGVTITSLIQAGRDGSRQLAAKVDEAVDEAHRTAVAVVGAVCNVCTNGGRSKVSWG